ncbi:MAG: S9 family peptidase, partial [Alphaproteobacteria bacterium]|nr:S9 family peptidase [Alphaproteobacteria bacterium]
MNKLFTAAIALTALTMPGYAAAQSNGADTSVSETAPTSPPVAQRREHSYTTHGITLSDPYHWLKDQSYPVVDDAEVLDYVKAENAWFEAQMAPHQALVDELFEE